VSYSFSIAVIIAFLRYLRRTFRFLTGLLAVTCCLLLIAAVVLIATTRHAALVCLLFDPLHEAVAHRGALYWQTELDPPYDVIDDDDMSGFFLADPDWVPIIPGARVSSLGFGHAQVLTDRVGESTLSSPPRRVEITEIPLWFVGVNAAVAALGSWLAGGLVRERGNETAASGPASLAMRVRRRFGSLLAGGSVLLLVASAVIWYPVATWHNFEVAWLGEERQLAIRSESPRCDLELAIEQIPADPPGSSRYANTGWQLDWNMSFSPAEFRGRAPARRLLPWFRSTDEMAPAPMALPAGGWFAQAPQPPPPPPTMVVVGHRWGLPFWFLMLAAVVLPALRLVVYLRRRRRLNTGFCQDCGYDLRASPGRCPECGKAVNSPDRPPLHQTAEDV
jgi:hypothetical protein